MSPGASTKQQTQLPLQVSRLRQTSNWPVKVNRLLNLTPSKLYKETVPRIRLRAPNQILTGLATKTTLTSQSRCKGNRRRLQLVKEICPSKIRNMGRDSTLEKLEIPLKRALPSYGCLTIHQLTSMVVLTSWTRSRRAWRNHRVFWTEFPRSSLPLSRAKQPDCRTR